MANRILCARHAANYVCQEHCASICVSKFFKRDVGVHMEPKKTYKMTTIPTEDKITPPSKFYQKRVHQFGKILKRFENYLEKYPTVKEKYTVLKDGFVLLKKDFFTYHRVSYAIWRDEPLKDFTRDELTVYRQMPKQMLKAVPLLVVSVMPGGFFMLPIAFAFPKVFLTTHFMTKEQRLVYEVRELQRRLQYYGRVMDHFHIQSKSIAYLEAFKVIETIVMKLEHGLHPELEEIIAVEEAFQGYPYQTEKLHRSYARHLGEMNNMRKNASRLSEDGLILFHTDQAMMQEGIDSMSEMELINACFMRGLNADGLSQEEMVKYLTDWTTVSKHVNKNSASLLLHLPMLMTFNHPNNNRVMHKVWKKYFRLPKQ